MNYDKEFWNTFIEAYGCNIDGNARLFYLYSSDYDTEEESVSLKVLSESILEIVVYETEDDEVEGRKVQRKWRVINLIRMESISNVQLTSDVKETDLGEVVSSPEDLEEDTVKCDMCKLNDSYKNGYCVTCQEYIESQDKEMAKNRLALINQYQIKLTVSGISDKYRRYCISELRKLGVEPNE